MQEAWPELADLLQWKAKCGGTDVSEAWRLKARENENAKLKRMLADSKLDNVALRDSLGKSGDAASASRGGGACSWPTK